MSFTALRDEIHQLALKGRVDVIALHSAIKRHLLVLTKYGMGASGAHNRAADRDSVPAKYWNEAVVKGEIALAAAAAGLLPTPERRSKRKKPTMADYVFVYGNRQEVIQTRIEKNTHLINPDETKSESEYRVRSA